MNFQRASKKLWSAVTAETAAIRLATGIGDMAALTAIVERLSSAAEAVNPQLGVLVGGSGPEPEVVITANGRRTAFGDVETLVGGAPVINGLTVRRAFRPRVPLAHVDDLAVAADGSELAARDVRVTVTESARAGMVDITLVIPGYLDEHPPAGPVNSPLMSAALLLVDHVIGEYDTETRIGVIAGAAPDASQVTVSLRELVAIVDDLPSRSVA